jgi:hypothetical protein
MKNNEQEFSEAETVKRREAALKKLLATPHKPHKAKKAKPAKKPRNDAS